MLRFETPEQARVWFEQMTEAARKRAILATAARLVSHIQNVVIPQTKPQPVDRGVYRAGWRFAEDGDGAVVYNATPQAPLIEYGVRAGNVKIGGAIKPLTEWVKRKLRPTAKAISARAKKSSKKKFTDAEARRIAWAIAITMKKKGIFNGGKGLRVLERAVPTVPGFFRAEMKRELARRSK